MTGNLKRQVWAYYAGIAGFYDREAADRGDGPFWRRLVERLAPATVLDVGAGTGRSTGFFAAPGRRVVALDLYPGFAAVARRRLRDVGAVHLVVADQRDLALRTRFDLVAAVGDPFVHLLADEDRDRAFAAVARHLAPGGRFVLDGCWFPETIRRQAATPDGWVRERPLGGDDGLTLRQTWRLDPETRTGRARFEYLRGDQVLGGADFPARAWSSEELQARAAGAGLEIRTLWGGFDATPWHPATSRRLIAEMAPAG